MDNSSNYTFNGSEALAKSREDYKFYEVNIDDVGEKYIFATTVNEVSVYTDDDKTYHMKANCDSEVFNNYTLDYIISKKEYFDFINTKKKGEFRLKMFLKYSKQDLLVKKVWKNKHIDIRMTEDLYDQICADAKACKLEPSAYLRQLAKKKRPRKALSNDEFKIMSDFVKVYRNYENFFNAAVGTLKGMSADEKLKYIIESHAYSWWRKYLLEGMPIMKRMIEGQRMYSNNVWRDAQGRHLPKYGREVIALVKDGNKYKAMLAHRSDSSKEWNLPGVEFWLDVIIPDINNKED